MNPKETSPLAIASLAFSCLGALTLGILCIPGIICGMIAKKQVRRGEYSGGSLAQAGIIVGVAVLVLYVVIPALLLGGFGVLGFAAENPGIVIVATGLLIFLVLLPFAFTHMSKQRASNSLREIIDTNRNR